MPQSPKKAFALRLDPALYATVERLAAQDLRSVNAELECLLREARPPAQEPGERMMLISLVHRRPSLLWPLLPVSTLLLTAGLFLLAWPA